MSKRTPARKLLDEIAAYFEYFHQEAFDCQPPRYTPRGVGAFGKTKTDTWEQAVMIDGVRFFVTVEKDINQ